MYLFDSYLQYFKHYGIKRGSGFFLENLKLYYDQKIISIFPSDFESVFV